jgi:hypothetical protein
MKVCAIKSFENGKNVNMLGFIKKVKHDVKSYNDFYFKMEKKMCKKCKLLKF